MEVLISHVLDREGYLAPSRMVLSLFLTQWVVAHKHKLLPVAHWSIMILPIVKETAFKALDHLVLLHLCHSLLIHREDAVWNTVVVHASLILMVTDTSSELIHTVTLHTLRVKVAPIEAICQIINVVQQVALGAARLVIDFDLVDESSTFDLEVAVQTS